MVAKNIQRSVNRQHCKICKKHITNKSLSNKSIFLQFHPRQKHDLTGVIFNFGNLLDKPLLFGYPLSTLRRGASSESPRRPTHRWRHKVAAVA